MRLTLRTLLAYLDDTLDPAQSREIGRKVAENPPAQELIDKIKKVTRRRGLATPPAGPAGGLADPNTVTAYLSDTLTPDAVAVFEKNCLESDVHLAEVAAVHQILTLLLCEQARVPPRAHRRMYELVEGRESLPNRRPGNTIPVGGARDDIKPRDDGDDAAYLLGMSGYTRSEAPGQHAVKVVAGVGLALLVLVGTLLAWPKEAGPRRTVALATPAVPPEPTHADALPPAPAVREPSAEVAPSPLPAGTRPPDPVPAKVPVDQTAPPPVVEPPVSTSPIPVTPAAGPPAPVAVPAPSGERARVGRWERKEPAAVLVRRPTGADGWQRVLAETPELFGADRLVALPGYKALLLFDTRVTAELWGNLPDLLASPIPLLEASVTPAVPPASVDADVTVHAGRVYLGTRNPAGAVVRVRAAGHTWDVKLADDKSELAVEVVNFITPPADPALGRASGEWHVSAGSVTVTDLAVPPASLPFGKGAEAYFDSRKPGVDYKPSDAKAVGRAGYWSKFAVSRDAASATLALTALDDFSKKLTNPGQVRGTFDAGLPTDPMATRQSVAAARVAAYALAALGDERALVGLLTDPDRPLLRSIAADGMRSATALDPTFLDRVKPLLAGQQGMPPADVAEAVRLLRGLSDADRNDPATAGRVVSSLKSASLAVRELAFGLLAGSVDPKDAAAKTLLQYDAGAASAARTRAADAWEKWAADLATKKAGPAKGPG